MSVWLLTQGRNQQTSCHPAGGILSSTKHGATPLNGRFRGAVQTLNPLRRKVAPPDPNGTNPNTPAQGLGPLNREA